MQGAKTRARMLLIEATRDFQETINRPVSENERVLIENRVILEQIVDLASKLEGAKHWEDIVSIVKNESIPDDKLVDKVMEYITGAVISQK